MSVKKGIDVSYAQGNIDFAKVDKNEVEFAIVRSSFGWEANQKDKQCDRNIKGFQNLGIPCGVYHYSYATNTDEAVKEAKYCISCIKDYKLELPVFFDIEEDSTAKLGKRICTDIVKAFCDYMIKSGYNAGVYANLNWFNNYLYKEELIGKYDIWLAHWKAEKPGFDCDLWQYNVGEKGTVKGISGEIDLNYMYKDYNISVKESSSSTNSVSFKKGDIVKVINPINYDNGKKFAVYDNVTYTVIEVVGDRVVIGINGQVTSAVSAKNIKKISTIKEVEKGSTVKVKQGAITYMSNIKLADWCYNTKFTVMELSGNRAVIGIGGKVTAAVNKNDLIVQ